MLAEGVTVITPEIGPEPAFVAVNPDVFPTPFAPKPMVVFVFVQLNVVPITLPVKAVAGTAMPLQYVLLVTAFTFGIGFTKIV